MTSPQRIAVAAVPVLVLAGLVAWNRELARRVSALEDEVREVRALASAAVTAERPRRSSSLGGAGLARGAPVDRRGAPPAEDSASAPVVRGPRWAPATDVERSLAASPAYRAAQRCVAESASSLDEVTVRFKLNEGGSATDLHVEAAQDPELQKCVAAALGSFRQAKPSGRVEPGQAVIYAD